MEAEKDRAALLAACQQAVSAARHAIWVFDHSKNGSMPGGKDFSVLKRQAESLLYDVKDACRRAKRHRREAKLMEKSDTAKKLKASGARWLEANAREIERSEAEADLFKEVTGREPTPRYVLRVMLDDCKTDEEREVAKALFTVYPGRKAEDYQYTEEDLVAAQAFEKFLAERRQNDGS